MAEDEAVKESSHVKIPLRGPEAAKATMERLQKKGILPQREKPSPPESGKGISNPVSSVETESYVPLKKAFPQAPEVQKKIVESYPGEETIPPQIKQELTDEANRLNTIAMGTGEATSEDLGAKGPPETKAPPAPPIEHLEAKGGAEPLRRILQAQRETEQPEKDKVHPVPTTLPAPEKEVAIPSQVVAPASAPWVKREEEHMVQGTHGAAVAQVGAEPHSRPPFPSREEIGAKQSIAQGQEIRKHWYDRLPFLRALRGEKSPA